MKFSKKNQNNQANMPPAPGSYPPGSFSNQEPVKKKKRKWPWVILAILLLIIIIGSCGGGNKSTSSNSSTDSSSPEQAETLAPPAVSQTTDAMAETQDDAPAETTEAATSDNSYTIRVTSSAGKGTVVYGTSGSSATESFEGGSWEKPIELSGRFDAITVSVAGDFMATDNQVHCEILKGEEVVKTSDASGQTASASCLYTPGM